MQKWSQKIEIFIKNHSGFAESNVRGAIASFCLFLCEILQINLISIISLMREPIVYTKWNFVEKIHKRGGGAGGPSDFKKPYFFLKR